MKEGLHISTDKSLLDINFIHGFMSQNSYWARDRSKEQTKKTIENSLCFGVYADSKEQIGFARVVSDYVFFGNIMDVIIDPDYQGKGLGKTLIEFMLNDDIIKGLQTITLKTKDAHSFYERYGFKKVGDSMLYMALDKQKLE